MTVVLRVGADAPLDNTASRLSLPDDQATDPAAWREIRYGLRRTAGKVIGGRVKDCGHAAVGTTVGIVRGDHGGHHFSGIETCGSVWVCPVCAAKITERRREEVKWTLEAALDEGSKAAMFTLTIPHTRFDDLGTLRRGVSKCWEKVQAGVGWKAMKVRTGFIGSIRALEVTHGGNGWHPHLHVVIVFDQGLNQERLSGFSSELFARWARAVEREGFGVCSEKAFSVEPIHDAEGVSKYCQKWGAAEELTKAHVKKGREGGRTPFQILADIHDAEHAEVIEGGDRKKMRQDRALFSDYSSSFKGARQLTWSRGLRQKYMGEPEHTDEEIAGEEPASSDHEANTEALISRDVWRPIAKAGLQAQILTAMDRGGSKAVSALLRQKGIRFCQGELVGLHGNVVTIFNSAGVDPPT